MNEFVTNWPAGLSWLVLLICATLPAIMAINLANLLPSFWANNELLFLERKPFTCTPCLIFWATLVACIGSTKLLPHPITVVVVPFVVYGIAYQIYTFNSPFK